MLAFLGIPYPLAGWRILHHERSKGSNLRRFVVLEGWDFHFLLFLPVSVQDFFETKLKKCGLKWHQLIDRIFHQKQLRLFARIKSATNFWVTATTCEASWRHTPSSSSRKHRWRTQPERVKRGNWYVTDMVGFLMVSESFLVQDSPTWQTSTMANLPWSYDFHSCPGFDMLQVFQPQVATLVACFSIGVLSWALRFFIWFRKSQSASDCHVRWQPEDACDNRQLRPPIL